MSRPTPARTPSKGNQPVRDDGFSYLPRFLSAQEVTTLATLLGGLHPIWEQRHADGGRLTRPVYWFGAWQFAALGYYSEPDHTLHKCVRAESLPEALVQILERLRPELANHGDDRIPNTALVNYYGHTPKGPGKPPVDLARLRMHRDHEPGPVTMLSIGQPAQFELVDPDLEDPVHSQWVRNRSVVILSGPEYKDRLYHRVTRVRHGEQPVLTCDVPDFCLRRISISFRHVPNDAIHDFAALPDDVAASIQEPMAELAAHRPHFHRQLDRR